MVKQLSLQQMVQCGLEANLAARLLPQLNQQLSTVSPTVDSWQHLIQTIPPSEHTFLLHQLLYETILSDLDVKSEPLLAWVPTLEQVQATNLAALMQALHINTYTELHHWSVQHHAKFWEMMLQRLNIQFRQAPTQILELLEGWERPYWLRGARLNIVESCFQASPQAPAIAFQSEDSSLQSITVSELQALTYQVANGLVELEFKPGDAIAIVMPMTVEAVAIYLGIIAAGCIVVSIADSFAACEIETRLRIARAKAVFTQDLTQRGHKQHSLYTKVISANAPRTIVLGFKTKLSVELRPDDLSWASFLSPKTHFQPIATEALAYTNILFSSGTTGEPKAIPWTQTTPIKCAADGHLYQDIHPGDVVAWPTNLGWMMGPWLIYASLINQATIALYDGTPCDRAYGQFIQDAQVTMLGVVPSLVNTWKGTQCMQGLDWSHIKAFSSTGECSNPQDMFYLMALAGNKPVIEYCGGTEIGGAYITGTLVQPCAPATFTTPALGLDIVLLDETGNPTDKGEAFIIPPSLGLSTELLNNNHHQVYFAHTPCNPHAADSGLPDAPPLRRHGDYLERLPNGYYRAHGRVDDTLNLGGIKVSTTEIEQVLNRVEGICETAAIAVSKSDGGPSQLVIYAVVATHPAPSPEQLKTQFQTAITQQLNPLFKVHHVIIIDALPRTASNKVMRRVLRDRHLQSSL